MLGTGLILGLNPPNEVTLVTAPSSPAKEPTTRALFKTLPAEVLQEIIKTLPPGKELFTVLPLVSRRFDEAVNLTPVCISCTLTLVPPTDNPTKQVVWLQSLKRSTFKMVRVPKISPPSTSTPQSTVKPHYPKKRKQRFSISETLMISVAEVHAMISMRSIMNHEPQHIIELLLHLIDMSVFFGARPGIVKAVFERFVTTGCDLTGAEEADKVGKFAAQLGPLSTVTLKSLDGIEKFDNLRTLKIPVIEGFNAGEKPAKCWISRLEKLSKLVIDQGVSFSDFLVLNEGLPSLESLDRLILNDPHEFFVAHKQGKIPPHASLDRFRCLRVRVTHMDTIALSTLADMVAHYFTNLTTLGIDFYYYVSVTNESTGRAETKTIDLAKDHFKRILKRLEASTMLRKVVFIMNLLDYRNEFIARYQQTPNVFNEVTSLKASLTFNVFEDM
ncbi:hypothetical protein HDU76_000809 [Blyttiomyces sp. JEL0837]|nr:hypothetical protein HDU76_000809 [Blyttiomyces sp. JEL0837]